MPKDILFSGRDVCDLFALDGPQLVRLGERWQLQPTPMPTPHARGPRVVNGYRATEILGVGVAKTLAARGGSIVAGVRLVSYLRQFAASELDEMLATDRRFLVYVCDEVLPLLLRMGDVEEAVRSAIPEDIGRDMFAKGLMPSTIDVKAAWDGLIEWWRGRQPVESDQCHQSN